MLTRLPHRIVIQTETRTEFEGGAYTTSWTTASTEWANVQRINAQETYDEEKKQQMSKWNVVTRQDITLTNAQRILFEGKILVVESQQDPTNRDRMKIVTCREEVL